jgi:hypothetical protein
MLLTNWEVANAIIDGEQPKLDAVDFSKIDWVEVMQVIQGLLGKDIDEAEESCDPERDAVVQKQYFNRVRAYASQFKVELPELAE